MISCQRWNWTLHVGLIFFGWRMQRAFKNVQVQMLFFVLSNKKRGGQGFSFSFAIFILMLQFEGGGVAGTLANLSLEYEWTDILLESAPSGWFWQLIALSNDCWENQLCTFSFTVITLQSVAQLITTVTECLSLSALPLQINMDQPPHH